MGSLLVNILITIQSVFFRQAIKFELNERCCKLDMNKILPILVKEKNYLSHFTPMEKNTNENV